MALRFDGTRLYRLAPSKLSNDFFGSADLTRCWSSLVDHLLLHCVEGRPRRVLPPEQQRLILLRLSSISLRAASKKFIADVHFANSKADSKCLLAYKGLVVYRASKGLNGVR